MNDFELESKLKSVPVPDRSPDYWEDFPSRVRVQLRPQFVERQQNVFWPRLAWAGGLAFACVMFAVVLPAVNTALQKGPALRKELAELPHHLRVFMADEHGLNYLIADQQ